MDIDSLILSDAGDSFFILASIVIFLGLCGAAFKGAVILFSFASKGGLILLGAFGVACVCLFPIMFIICMVIGLLSLGRST